MKKLLLAGVAGIAVIAAGSANAADLGTRPTYKAPPPVVAPVPYFSWTGCYIGAQIGAGWGRKDVSEPDANDNFAEEGDRIRVDTGTGLVGGGQIGCDYQFAPGWVIGIEGAALGAGLKGDVVDPFKTSKGAPINLHAKTDFLASVTGRVGWGWDRVLLYAKGGVAWADDHYSATGVGCGSICPTPFDFAASETRTGWTVGGGLEWAFAGPWSAKVEFAYYDFGTRSVNLTDPVFGVTPADIKQRIETVTVGINYRFGWGKAPVTARY